MNHSAHRTRGGFASSAGNHRRQPVVCVVDARPGDYSDWTNEAAAAGVQLHFAITAAEALRFRSDGTVDLWVVNERLAGLSGCELCEMLRSQASRSPVYVVSDEYSPAAEQAALRARATLYGCKGAHRTWLADWLHTRAQHGALAAA